MSMVSSRGILVKREVVTSSKLAMTTLGSIHFLAGGGESEEFGGGSANFDKLQRGAWVFL